MLVNPFHDYEVQNMNHDSYVSPLSTRYASREMQHIFSDNFKFRTWRRLWISLAKAENALGLDVTQEQIEELEAHKDDINYEAAQEREKLVTNTQLLEKLKARIAEMEALK